MYPREASRCCYVIIHFNLCKMILPVVWTRFILIHLKSLAGYVDFNQVICEFAIPTWVMFCAYPL